MFSFDRPIQAFVQAASGGIGCALVERLLGSSTVERVVATCRRPSQASALTELQARHPHRLEVLPLDLLQEESIRRVAEQLRERGRKLNLIVNCSGLLHSDTALPEKRLSQVRSAALEESFRVNAIGPLLVLKHLAPLLPRRGRSVVASLSARVGSVGDNRLGGWYGYRASKAALNMFHRTLSVELSRSHPGCICVVLHPGTVDTELSKPFQGRVPKGKLFEPEFAATRLLGVIDSLETNDTGTFWAWDGQPIPW